MNVDVVVVVVVIVDLDGDGDVEVDLDAQTILVSIETTAARSSQPRGCSLAERSCEAS